MDDKDGGSTGVYSVIYKDLDGNLKQKHTKAKSSKQAAQKADVVIRKNESAFKDDMSIKLGVLAAKSINNANVNLVQWFQCTRKQLTKPIVEWETIIDTIDKCPDIVLALKESGQSVHKKTNKSKD